MSRRVETLFLMLMHEARDREMTAKVIEEHVEHLKWLESKGKLVVCGPFIEKYGALKVLRASSMEEARELAEADPFIREGIETYELHEFKYAHEGNGYLMR